MTAQRDKPKNVPASVRAKLLTLARAKHEDFQLVLQRYANERVLFRLSISSYAHDFVLKGATLFSLWMDAPHRSTKDVDLLGKGDNSPEHLREVFKNIIAIKPEVDDGLVFNPESVEVERIREEERYEGVRVTFKATLEKAQISLQVDIGFGDAVVPGANSEVLPTLLDLPSPTLNVYPIQSVIAEKFEAMVSSGLANSRMKDFFDLYTFASAFDIDGSALSEAIQATFERRGTNVPTDVPLALKDEFRSDKDKIAQWKGFQKRTKLAEGADLATVTGMIGSLILPAAKQMTLGKHWSPGGPWK